MIRHATPADSTRLEALHRRVASIPDGLARTPAEVTTAYIDGFMTRAASHGVELVWDEDGQLLGEIHCARPEIASLSHLLTDLTIAVDPSAQGRGVGRALFQGLLDHVLVYVPHISRVELFARSSNQRARALYLSLGFVDEGLLRRRVNNSKGMPEDDTLMGWLRPA